MGEPIQLQNLFFSTLSGGAIVLMGAFYALFFALSQLHKSRYLIIAYIISYLLLAAAVYVLAISLHLEGFWLIVCAVMLVGYFVAPRIIWRLCIDTHEVENPKSLSDSI